MPVFAHFDELSREGERRHSRRRALKLGAAAGESPVTIRDISLTGMLLETATPMLVGSGFEIDLPHSGRIAVAVVWNSGEFYGCEFEYPISPAAVSAARLQSEPVSGPESAASADAVEELRALNADVERISARLDRAIDRLSGE
jgi:PilZ domain